MFDSLAYAIAGLAFALQLYIVARAVVRGEFVKYLTINIYMLACALTNAGQFVFYRYFGYGSDAFKYLYYYSNGVCTVLLYFVILSLYQQIFEDMAVSKYIRGGAVLLLGLTAVFSFLVVDQNKGKLLDAATYTFVWELSQNMNFVGLVLTYLLWFAVKQMKESRLRLLQVVLSLGIYFAGLAAVFALISLRDAYPSLRWITFDIWLGPILAVFLPLSWAITFTRIPEEARLATASVARAHR